MRLGDAEISPKRRRSNIITPFRFISRGRDKIKILSAGAATTHHFKFDAADYRDAISESYAERTVAADDDYLNSACFRFTRRCRRHGPISLRRAEFRKRPKYCYRQADMLLGSSAMAMIEILMIDEAR